MVLSNEARLGLGRVYIRGRSILSRKIADISIHGEFFDNYARRFFAPIAGIV
jgi:hypothetical protein